MQPAGGGKPLSEVGEFGLITGIGNIARSSRVRSSGLVLGIGDDTAIWQPRPGRAVAITTDTLVEDVHYRNDWIDPKDLGQRALAVNISDLASMGARPRVALVTLALRGTEKDRWVYEIYRGMLAYSHKVHVRVAGGDIVHSPQAASISVTAIGELRSADAAMRRDRAQVGDVIAVTGPLGLAAAGVRILKNGNCTLDGAPEMIRRHQTPTPRLLHGILLSRAGVRCAMDLSDGLLGDLPKICEASDVSALIEEDRLPIPNALRWSFTDWFDLALRGGEDYELLFTAPPEVYARTEQLFRRCRLAEPIRIGTIVELGGKKPQVTMRHTDLRREVLSPGAFDHFSRPAMRLAP
jgi:thiamine-monophosphate kinase